MIASNLISSVIPSLRPTDTVSTALERMMEFKVAQLPIVNRKHFLGLVTEDELNTLKNQDLPIEGLNLNLLNVFSYDNSHVYELIRLFSKIKLSLVPVLNQQRHYIGLVTLMDITNYTAQLFAVNEPGAVIVLSVNHRNNSLAHIAQIVELENTQILSSYVSSYPDSTRIEITLKLNKTDISAIVASFERYEYEILAVFNNSGADNNYLDRYDSFMNYLNV